jgi:hypothetical protein
MADFPANMYTVPTPLLEGGSPSVTITMPAEALASQAIAAGTTYNYLMIGYDTVFPLVPTVWYVVGTPDLTGALSGNPTINAATIRQLLAWVG